MSLEFDTTWMWHPAFSEEQGDTAGLFVYFRREFEIKDEPPKKLMIHITADTRYKLYLNGQYVAFGPVKGDRDLWFYDSIDIAPFLRQGHNRIGVHVLRFFHSTSYAPSFPRLPLAGLRVSVSDEPWAKLLESSALWEAAIDHSTVLRVDEPEDRFLHIYERTSRSETRPLEWVASKLLEFKNSTGNSPPWQLSPRLVPPLRVQDMMGLGIHNVHSTLKPELWSATLLKDSLSQEVDNGLLLPAETKHFLDFEMPHLVTAFLRLRFKRPGIGGGTLTVTYSESYEDESEETPWVRQKGDRCDYNKTLLGPKDIYEFQGVAPSESLGYYGDEDTLEVFMPFHFRTFRFLHLDFDVGPSDLVFLGLSVESVNYPLNVCASFAVAGTEPEQSDTWHQLWETSIRTLYNCMHDCYEDCPFYEQLQYAMDTRSSSLFTYLVSGDDRLARQAIIQLHNSFQARLGLTASRAPSHREQFIPHFSLYWVNLVADHWVYFGDKAFTSQFLSVIDAVLRYFDRRVDHHGLVTSEVRPGIWNFVDWAREWKPHGIPPAINRTSISTYANQLYAYTLKHAAQLVNALGREAIALEYRSRAENIISALEAHCFDGQYFPDTLVSAATSTDYSQHCQVWAVLCGAVAGENAERLLRGSLERTKAGHFVQESISMSFYTMRALSLAGGTLYNENFVQFWDPWRQQLQQNVTTWVEDSVSQRSDCHAWGSVSIYEFMVEVVGIRPAEPGWVAIEFRPRLGLFRNMNAKVPVKMKDGKEIGLVHVSWATDESGNAEVRLRLDFEGSAKVPVRAFLPGVEMACIASEEEMRFIIQKDLFVRYP
ncbi:hypothetical protein LRP88_05684 [Fusarium phalaenopsidis]